MEGKVAVITGAASGIGRDIALEMARRGCDVAISDVNEAALNETAALLATYQVRVKADMLDVSQWGAFEAYAKGVVAYFGHVDMVINNAGRSVADGFVSGSREDFKMIMDINFWGAYHGSKVFLPYLMERPEGAIANISSVNAFIPFPNQSSYNVSKSAIAGLSESLRQELRGTGVNVMCVYPGGVRTNIVRNSKFINGPKDGMTQEESASYFEKVAVTSSPKAARRIVKGLMKKKKRLLIGPDAYLFAILKRLTPRFSVWLVGRIASS